MSNPSSPVLSCQLQIDTICDDFELAWQQSLARRDRHADRPRLEDYIGKLKEEHRSALFRELLSVDVAYRSQCGEERTRAEYLERFPDQRDAVREALAPSTGDPGTEPHRPVPEKIGRYAILSLVDSGSFGTVYRATDSTLQRDVAIKVPHQERFSQQEDREAYLSEARILASLRHPHIVLVHDVAEADDGQFYTVSQFIDGDNLAERIKKQRLTFAESAELVATMAEALHYAHGQGLVHRDVKPANILLDSNKQPYLADFGLALKEEDYGRTGRQGGTVIYMSPEQARGEGHLVDGRSDIFSLGAVFYELLSGTRPFHGATHSEMLNRIINVDARPLRTVDDAIPKELERICLKALAKRVTDRYAVAKDMAEDLRHFLELKGSARAAQVKDASADKPTKVVPKGLRSFDARDADFFLDLVPGPRDRDDLPETVQFWKEKIEQTDPDETFRVGLVYGPSGCGKSSLVKAGLLPRLSDQVLTVYLEATSAGTEQRLLRALRKSHHDLPPDTDLVGAVAALRRARGTADGEKVLIVLDQFEQWLHAQEGEFDGELVQALRQCDGGRVQCIVLVRDDFWLGLSRFLDHLDIDLREGENAAFVDLFDQRHAGKVLVEFGRAYGCLPDDPRDMSPDQERFVDRVVRDLSREGKVISVRLALFAEMVKGKPWTSETLHDVHGTEGVGVMFLDDTLGTSANPRHRQHRKAAHLVLDALVPETGTDIRGSMRPVAELREISGYADRSRDFDHLMRILDSETRLLTPTDPESEPAGDSSAAATSGKYYQLTHDYLVPALRRWLTRDKRNTRCGRAELRLAEWTAAWKVKRDNRHLPSWWEVLNVWCCTRKADWTEPQRAMMRKAGAHLALRGVLGLALVGAVLFAGVSRWRRGLADAKLDALLTADISRVEQVKDDLSPYRSYVEEDLLEVYRGGKPGRKLRAAIALFWWNGGDKYLRFFKERFFAARLDEVPVLRDVLLAHIDHLPPETWDTLMDDLWDNVGDQANCLRAAAALAVCDENIPRWKSHAGQIVDALLSVKPVDLVKWIEILRKANPQLKDSFSAAFRDHQRPEMARINAAVVLGTYLDEPEEPKPLVDLLLDAIPSQFVVLYPQFEQWHQQDLDDGKIVKELRAELARTVNASAPLLERDGRAKRQANAAIALLRLGAGDETDAWSLFKRRRDPSSRSYLIDRAVACGVNPRWLLERMEAEQDDSARQALLLAFGQLDVDSLPRDLREKQQEMVDDFLDKYKKHEDPGVRSAAQWILQRWNEDKKLAEAGDDICESEQGLGTRGDDDQRRWYVGCKGQTMVVVPPFVRYTTPDQPAAVRTEPIDYPMLFSVGGVTKRQFKAFAPEFDPPLPSGDDLDTVAPEPDCPVLAVNWFEAAAYCNWLSSQEGIAEGQWCYVFIRQGSRLKVDFLRKARDEGVKWLEKTFWSDIEVYLAPGWQQKTGYRLPTEAEWEHACMGGVNTGRFFFGTTDELLPKYASYSENSAKRGAEGISIEQSWPAGTRLPNVLGLFDMHGNTWEWCQPEPDPKNATSTEYGVVVPADEEGTLRGGSYAAEARRQRFDHTTEDRRLKRDRKDGFRVVRRLAKDSPLIGFLPAQVGSSPE